MEKKLYNSPQTEVMMLQGLNVMQAETTSLFLPPDMAPKKRVQVF